MYDCDGQYLQNKVRMAGRRLEGARGADGGKSLRGILMKKRPAVPLPFQKYLSFFRLRCAMGLQYRAAAIGGIFTQLLWGCMGVLLYDAFYRANPAAFPMEFSALSSYLWLQEAFLLLFQNWFIENELLFAVSEGQVCYELARPVDLYGMWMARSYANRISRTLLRSAPLLALAALIPYPYGLSLPASWPALGLTIASALLSLTITVSITLLLCGLTFYTISPRGVRALLDPISMLLAGGIVPLPFFPDGIRQAVELLPFASMQNVPLRIYSGNLAGLDALFAIGLQLFWAVALVALGRLLFSRALRKVVAQGG